MNHELTDALKQTKENLEFFKMSTESLATIEKQISQLQSENERLREALNYARSVYTEACVVGDDKVGLSEFDEKITAILTGESK